MLEIQRIRNEKEAVIEGLKKRNIDATETIEKLLDVDHQWRNSKSELESIAAELNTIAKEIGDLFKQGKQEEANAAKSKTADLKAKESELKVIVDSFENDITQLLYQLPNVPNLLVPAGKNELDNETILEVGTKREYDFEAVPHWDLAKKYDLIDFELGVKITGAGFPIYKGKGAKLQRALIAFFLEEAEKAGYQEFIPPLVVNEASGYGTGQLPDKEGQMYYVNEDDLYLIPTAEVPLTNIYRDVILPTDNFSIKMTGYTTEEKVEIARQHLFPKQLKEHGLTSKNLSMGKKQLEKIVEGYTRESGVRSLEQKIAQVIRNAAKSVAMNEDYNVKVNDEDIVSVLGSPKLERDKAEGNEVAGVVTGLAWTSVGGDILFIESLISKGKGVLTLTGNLGTVMKESATIALEYIKANAEIFGLNPDIISNYNIHLHVPEGATPKDGPSAGIAMLTSLVSLFTQRKIKKGLAMTGEITLRGKVLPVGGIKEKILAAKRANIKDIILCYENKSDIDEIKSDYLEGLTFHYVKEMSEVISIAITKDKVKNAKIID